MHFLHTVTAAIALWGSSAFAAPPMGKVVAWSEPGFRGQRAVYDAPAQCENLQVPRPRSLEIPPGTVCRLFHTTGCRDEGLADVQHFALGYMAVVYRPVSFVCHSTW